MILPGEHLLLEVQTSTFLNIIIFAICEPTESLFTTKENIVYICEQLPFYGRILCYIGESWIHKIPDGIASCQMCSNKFGQDGIFLGKHDESDLWGIVPVLLFVCVYFFVDPSIIFRTTGSCSQSLQWPSLRWSLRLMVHCRFMMSYKMCTGCPKKSVIVASFEA